MLIIVLVAYAVVLIGMMVDTFVYKGMSDLHAEALTNHTFCVRCGKEH